VYIIIIFRFDAKEARERFPRLLQLLATAGSGEYGVLEPEFVSMAEQVPPWMFIAWIPQMVSLLDKREAGAVHGILEQLAKQFASLPSILCRNLRSYPAALKFPLLISSEQFVFSDSAQGAKSKAKFKEIQVSPLCFVSIDWFDVFRLFYETTSHRPSSAVLSNSHIRSMSSVIGAKTE
jgi:DNA-dependent protein kinase catalytic subunit